MRIVLIIHCVATYKLVYSIFIRTVLLFSSANFLPHVSMFVLLFMYGKCFILIIFVRTISRIIMEWRYAIDKTCNLPRSKLTFHIRKYTTIEISIGFGEIT